ncbi:MAG TPA: putative glycoside hydrolase [Solirubrobacteraceae bacterium]|nr:putative glycoside hydrolase [Solirubrobacteraceae bacterium]
MTAGRNQYVILSFHQRARMQALKAANPSVKVLMYKNMSAISSGGAGPEYSSGVGYPEAGVHPEWLLKDTTGQAFRFWGYSWLWAADIGNTAYQDAWASNVIASAKAGGWDGVFMDDTNYSIKSHADPADVAKYPTDARYGAAMRSMVANVAPKLRAAGELAFANLQWAEFSSQANDWLQFLDGGMDEHFVKWGSVGEGYADPTRWARQLANVKEAERQGKGMLAVTQSTNTDQQAARFGWATALLGGQGHVYFALHGDYTNENWLPEYDYALGDPTGPESKDANGVHRRVFAGGLVLVNPTGTTQTVSFGATYSGCGVTGATSASMPAHTGLILTKAAGPAVPPAEPTPAPTSAPAPAPIPPGPTGDTTPPARPTGLHATSVRGKVLLDWSTNADDTIGYQVLRNGVVMAARPVTSKYADTSVAVGVKCTYRVRAADAAGNLSAWSRPVTVRSKRRRAKAGKTARAKGLRVRKRHHVSARSRSRGHKVRHTAQIRA